MYIKYLSNDFTYNNLKYTLIFKCFVEKIIMTKVLCLKYNLFHHNRSLQPFYDGAIGT